jgi:hypothetical protein
MYKLLVFSIFTLYNHHYHQIPEHFTIPKRNTGLVSIHSTFLLHLALATANLPTIFMDLPILYTSSKWIDSICVFLCLAPHLECFQGLCVL